MSIAAVAPTQQPGVAPSPPTPEAAPTAVEFHYTHTDSFVALLHQLRASLWVTTYQANKLLVVRAAPNGLSTLVRTFERPMGLAVDAHRMALVGPFRLGGGAGHRRNLLRLGSFPRVKHTSRSLPVKGRSRSRWRHSSSVAASTTSVQVRDGGMRSQTHQPVGVGSGNKQSATFFLLSRCLFHGRDHRDGDHRDRSPL
jgi:hypothetical protein